MAVATSSMRKAWAEFECAQHKMQRISFGPDEILVAPPSVEAWKALERVLGAYDYDIRIEDTDSYNCRDIKGGGGRSLHAYGIALDINWKTNPFRDHSGSRETRFARGVTQQERAKEVRLGTADTDMTPAMIQAVLAIRTNGGKRVFGWGGHWQNLKDAMHFQIEATPGDLSEGIDWGTVEGGYGGAVSPDPLGPLASGGGGSGSMVIPSAEPSSPEDIFRVGQEFFGDFGMLLSEGDRNSLVEALQRSLKALNYQFGAIDGYFGPLTKDAVLSFQSNNSLPITGIVDALTMAALSRGKPRMLSPERTGATEADLLSKGSTTLNAASWERWLGIGSAILGAFGMLDSTTSSVSRLTGALANASPEIAPIANLAGSVLGASGLGPWGVVVGLGYFILRNANTAAAARLRDHRTGANVGR